METQKDSEKRFFQRKDAGTYIGVSLFTFATLDIPFIRVGKKKKIYDRQDLDAWMMKHKQKAKGGKAK